MSVKSIFFLAVTAILFVCGAASAEGTKPSSESALSEKLLAARAAINGYPDYFMHPDSVSARMVVRTICAQINGGTTCLVYASDSVGKQVIAIRVEKEKGGAFRAIDLQHEKDLF